MTIYDSVSLSKLVESELVILGAGLELLMGLLELFIRQAPERIHPLILFGEQVF